MEEDRYFKEMFHLIGEIHYHYEHDQKTRLTKGEGAILYTLLKNPEGVTPGYLAKVLQVGSGRIGTALKNMEKKDFVQRKDDRNDRRRTVVTITEKGKERAIFLKNDLDNRFRYIVATMGKEKFEQYLDLCKQFGQCFISYQGKEEKAK